MDLSQRLRQPGLHLHAPAGRVHMRSNTSQRLSPADQRIGDPADPVLHLGPGVRCGELLRRGRSRLRLHPRGRCRLHRRQRVCPSPRQRHAALGRDDRLLLGGHARYERRRRGRVQRSCPRQSSELQQVLGGASTDRPRQRSRSLCPAQLPLVFRGERAHLSPAGLPGPDVRQPDRQRGHGRHRVHELLHVSGRHRHLLARSCQ